MLANQPTEWDIPQPIRITPPRLADDHLWGWMRYAYAPVYATDPRVFLKSLGTGV